MPNEHIDPLTDPKFARVRARLELDRDIPVPPPGLAMKTIGRMAELLVCEKPLTKDVPTVVPSTIHRATTSTDAPVYLGRRRADLIVAACIGFLVIGLSVTGVQKLRAEAGIRHCQNTLREIHTSLTGYADVHQGHYPTVGVSAGPKAGDFAEELARSGHLAPMVAPVCPSDDSTPAKPVSYAYTLGFRSPNGSLVGFRRPDPANGDRDGMPMLADFPAASSSPTIGGPVSPHGRGHNVLFAGGHVRYATVATVGIDGDDIYRNAAGFVGAGLTSIDVCLGRPQDRP